MDSKGLVRNTIYSLELYPERLYGKVLTDVTFKGRIDSSLVSVYGVIPSVEHTKVYPTLPSGTPNSSEQYDWLLFSTINGNLIVIGEPWIIPNTLSGGDVIDLWDITSIKGNSETPALIKNALSKVGIYEYNIVKQKISK